MDIAGSVSDLLEFPFGEGTEFYGCTKPFFGAFEASSSLSDGSTKGMGYLSVVGGRTGKVWKTGVTGEILSDKSVKPKFITEATYGLDPYTGQISINFLLTHVTLNILSIIGVEAALLSVGASDSLRVALECAEVVQSNYQRHGELSDDLLPAGNYFASKEKIFEYLTVDNKGICATGALSDMLFSDEFAMSEKSLYGFNIPDISAVPVCYPESGRLVFYYLLFKDNGREVACITSEQAIISVETSDGLLSIMDEVSEHIA